MSENKENNQNISENILENNQNLDDKFIGTIVVVKEGQSFNDAFFSFNKLVKQHKIRRLKKNYFISRGQKNRQKGYKKTITLKQNQRRKEKFGNKIQ